MKLPSLSIIPYFESKVKLLCPINDDVDIHLQRGHTMRVIEIQRWRSVMDDYMEGCPTCENSEDTVGAETG